LSQKLFLRENLTLKGQEKENRRFIEDQGTRKGFVKSQNPLYLILTGES